MVDLVFIQVWFSSACWTFTTFVKLLIRLYQM